jgi:predicted nucleic acid-binding protein
MILDTNAISAWWSGEETLRPVLESASALELPVPALAEFRFGILKSRLKERMLPWLVGVQSANRVLGIDAETTRHYADIRLELQNASTPIPMNDLWIAAIARQHKQPILSRDTHFDQVPGITRIGW